MFIYQAGYYYGRDYTESSNAPLLYSLFFHGFSDPNGPRPPQCRCFTITLRHTTPGRTPLDEWSVRRRLLPDNTQHSQETDIHAPTGFKSLIPASERPQTHAFDRAASGVAAL